MTNINKIEVLYENLMHQKIVILMYLLNLQSYDIIYNERFLSLQDNNLKIWDSRQQSPVTLTIKGK